MARFIHADHFRRKSYKKFVYSIKLSDIDIKEISSELRGFLGVLFSHLKYIHYSRKSQHDCIDLGSRQMVSL